MPFRLTHPEDVAERVEGEPFYQLACYTLASATDVASQRCDFAFRVRAFKVLPPCDAVGLLSGYDSTGLVVWSGALALLEWCAGDDERLAVAAAAGGHVVELGCGCGIATVGLCALLRRRALSTNTAAATLMPEVRVWATDGNPECVELAQRNVREQCCCQDGCVSASASELPWGDAAAAAELCRQCWATTTDGPAASSAVPLTIIAADVLYDAAAVPLLVATVADLVEAWAARSRAAGIAPASVEWWLAYTPRSLTRAGNECIFATLVEALKLRGWTHALAPLPTGSVTTGYEQRSDCDTPALQGCILIVSVPPHS